MRLSVPLRSAPNGQVNAERLVNLYAEEAGGKSEVQVLSPPGREQVADLGGDKCRGLFVHNEELYALTGTTLNRLSSAHVPTPVGTIPGAVTAVGASSGVELCVATGGDAYIYDGSTVTKITDPDFLGADSVDFLDGYFIFSNGADEFSISALYAGGTIDALDFASAESNPDSILRAFVDHRELLLFGERTVETWTNTGNADFPFERVSGSIIEKGIAGRYSVARVDNSVYWLDQDGIVRRVSGGYSPQRISTHQVEKSLTDIENAEAFAYTWQGHEFFVLTAGTTWVYDAATQTWHERQTYGKTRWNARCYAYCYGNHYVGDAESGKIYKLNEATLTDGDDIIVSEMVFPAIHNEQKRFRVHSLVLDMEVGEAPAYSEPEIRLDISDDGSTWNTVGTKTIGRTGNRNHRVVWRRLGQHKTLHIRIIVSEPCKRAMFSGYIEVSTDQ